MRHRSLILTCTLLTLTLPAHAEEPADPEAERAREFGRLNPAAPPFTAQFAFLIGEWECQTKSMKPDGSFHRNTGTWTGRYILNGWAIQDDWVTVRPDGTSFRGTNIRSWNPETNQWDNDWVPLGSRELKYFSAEKVGETMVMTGGEGDGPRGPFVDRNVFYRIGEDSWRWRKDRSWDGGETWFEGVAHIEAKRKR